MSKVFTLSEYLQYRTEFERFYEVENGQIVRLPTDSFLNNRIAIKLIMILAEHIDLRRISNKTEIIVSGRRFNSRFPDLVVFSKEQLPEVCQLKRSTISIDMLPPLLVVEVVSSGEKARVRNYRYKRSEYAARGIEYYWIIDPQQQTFSELKLVEGMYEAIVHDRTFWLEDPLKIKMNFKYLFLP